MLYYKCSVSVVSRIEDVDPGIVDSVPKTDFMLIDRNDPRFAYCFLFKVLRSQVNLKMPASNSVLSDVSVEIKSWI